MPTAPPIYQKALGLAIHNFREKSGYSQEIAGDIVGIKRAVISRYELGLVMPNLNNLKLLCKDVFKCEVSDLILEQERIEKELTKKKTRKKKNLENT